VIDNHTYNGPLGNATTMEVYKEKIYAFIFPNVPRTDEEKEAFEQAVNMQYTHDASAAMQSAASALPEGVTSYSAGDFHLTWEKGFNTSALTRATICPGAYGLLLRHGLLYRGVEGRR